MRVQESHLTAGARETSGIVAGMNTKAHLRAAEATTPSRPLTPKQQRFVDRYNVNVERLNSFIDRSAGPDGCWPWTGARDTSGYGRFHTGESANSTRLAHRLAFGAHCGEEPEAVCHRCDNPPCCNPAHLFGGTRAINVQDMIAKGRRRNGEAVRGERHPAAKLNAAQVTEIRERYAEGGATQRALAARYAVSQRTVAKVVNRIGWVDV